MPIDHDEPILEEFTIGFFIRKQTGKDNDFHLIDNVQGYYF